MPESSCPITVTESATTQLLEFIEKNNHQGKGIRIFVAGHACSGPSFGLSIDEISESDQVLKDGELTLLCDARLQQDISLGGGMTIDFETHPVYGAGFSLLLNNPSSGCGCGDSGCGGGAPSGGGCGSGGCGCG